MKQTSFVVILLALGTFLARSADPDPFAKQKPIIEVLKTAPEAPAKPVEKSEEEWRKTLTPEQYRILRQAGTEAPNGQVYKEFKNQGGGTYYCAGCGAELFTSNEKFDSHCGWPSFYDPATANTKTRVDYKVQAGDTLEKIAAEYATTVEKIKAANKLESGPLAAGSTIKVPSAVKYEVDFHIGYARTEVRCATCDGHLGHLFKGEGFDTPTDKRFCINGTVLKFVPHSAKDGAKSAPPAKKGDDS